MTAALEAERTRLDFLSQPIAKASEGSLNNRGFHFPANSITTDSIAPLNALSLE
jgi:hypothetical protein